MTFPASGQIADFGAELAAELRTSLPLTLPSDETRWLAEVPSGPMVIPTDFYDKSGVKLVDSYAHDSFSSSHSRANVNFGPVYAGRRIVVCINTSFPVNQSLNIGTVTVGGVSATGNDAGSFDGNGRAVGAGIFLANPSGASGTISFNTANPSRAYVWVLSVAGITTLHAREFSHLFNNPGGSVNINVPTNGVLIACYTQHSTSSHDYTGVEQRDNSLLDGGRSRGSFGWTNRLNVQSNRTVSVASGAIAYGLEVATFT